jgi:phosphatidylglycerol:prolipoprotein diacylglycerol transferase
MQQVLFRIPGLNWPIFGFGLMLFVAFVLTTAVAMRRAKREGINPEAVQDLALWVFVGGLLGARITFISMYVPVSGPLEFFLTLIKIWDGGIILYGAVLGAMVSYTVLWWFVFRKQKISTLKLFDVIAPSIALGLCIGRIGCFLNGCCWGQVACPDCAVYAVNFPLSADARSRLVSEGYQTAAGFTWRGGNQPIVGRVEPGSPAALAGLKAGDRIVAVDGNPHLASLTGMADYLGPELPKGQNTLRLTVQSPDDENPHDLAFRPRTLGLHPTQLYETISMGLLFLLLLAYHPFKSRDGQVMALLMIGYGLHRFINEKLRSDTRPVGFENYSSLILIGCGVLLALYLLRRPAQYRPQWTAAPSANGAASERAGSIKRGPAASQ